MRSVRIGGRHGEPNQVSAPTEVHSTQPVITNPKSKSAIVELKALIEDDEGRLRLVRGTRRTHPGSGRLPRRQLSPRPRHLRWQAGTEGVPGGREGRFSTELFERCQRSGQVLVDTLE